MTRERAWMAVALAAGMAASASAQERERVPPPTVQERIRVGPTGDRVYRFSNRGKMGITVNIRPQATDSIGALVDAVSPGSPAFKAGIQAGDLIVRFNGQSVVTLAREGRKPSPGLALLEVASTLNAGDTARVDYRRGRSRGNATIVLEPASEYAFTTQFLERGPGEDVFIAREWSEGMPPALSMQEESFERVPFMLPYKSIATLELAPMNAGLGQYFGVSTGVLVINTPDGSSLNLKSGDVVMTIDGRRVSSPNQLFRVLRSYDRGEPFRLEVMRMKRKEVVRATLEDR